MPTMTHQSTSLAELTLGELTAALASSAPTPGGGSAAATAASLGASLIAMVARLSQCRPRYEAHAQLHAEALAAADAGRVRLLRAADDDAAAYAAYREARQMPQATDAELSAREAASRATARVAVAVPLEVVQQCHNLIDVVERLAGRSSVAAASDLNVAALLLECAARGAAENALVNLPAVGDDAFATAITTEVEERLRHIQGAGARARERVGAIALPDSASA